MRKSFKKNTLSDEKRQRRNMIIMSVFMAFLMVSSVFAYIFFYTDGSTTQSVTENGYRFTITQQNGNPIWQTTVNKEPAYFYRLPSEVANIPVDAGAKSLIQSGSSVIVAVDSSLLSDQDIAVLFGQLANIPGDLGAGQTQNISQFNLPIVTCEYSTSTYPVAEVTYGDITQISSENGCVKITAPDLQSLFEVMEKFKFVYLKIE
jgi:hypothetical protein